MKEPDGINEAARAFENMGLVPVIEGGSYNILLSALSQRINKMIVEDFTGLLQLLYKIDIPEQKLKSILQSHANENAGNIIAAMMIDRQLQKIETRKRFDKKDDIADEERW